ncbi:putative ribosomal protein S17e [Helianthus annuus]|uniref:Ribosomal protein S17e n=1 Tax=Helianthus annuus TaxID=4232 RepID=A0A251SQN5_HELAN|nr:putative ribosomal protein S17e [Helianthus annuus]KAJ0476527.1 putative ribosomal protein S17e [Helianthus annuus]KAJ0497354.1 putative ribosomal protein S17e [Helianthus annuus]KAJ0663368.1 putative ribosomal protein S17e [Helianthus annuus]
MGRVRTKTVKKSSRQVIERYYSKMTLDFHTNKKILEEVAIIPSKRLRNKIAGFSTHLMKRIQKGPVRGISLKLQEEERERRMDFVPDESAIKVDRIEVDKETIDLLASLGMSELPGIVLKEDVPVVSGGIPGGYGGGGRGGFGGGAGRRVLLNIVMVFNVLSWIQVQHYKFNFCFVLFYLFLIKFFYLIFVIILRFGLSG